MAKDPRAPSKLHYASARLEPHNTLSLLPHTHTTSLHNDLPQSKQVNLQSEKVTLDHFALPSLCMIFSILFNFPILIFVPFWLY